LIAVVSKQPTASPLPVSIFSNILPFKKRKKKEKAIAVLGGTRVKIYEEEKTYGWYGFGFVSVEQNNKKIWDTAASTRALSPWFRSL
jgi:hypothetical protein